MLTLWFRPNSEDLPLELGGEKKDILAKVAACGASQEEMALVCQERTRMQLALRAPRGGGLTLQLHVKGCLREKMNSFLH